MRPSISQPAPLWLECSPTAVHVVSAALQVGAVNNTFGVQGVWEHCWFLKSIDEAHKLRVHLRFASECFVSTV